MTAFQTAGQMAIVLQPLLDLATRATMPAACRCRLNPMSGFGLASR